MEAPIKADGTYGVFTSCYDFENVSSSRAGRRHPGLACSTHATLATRRDYHRCPRTRCHLLAAACLLVPFRPFPPLLPPYLTSRHLLQVQANP